MNSLPVVYDPSVASSASSAVRAKILPAPPIADARPAANDDQAEANANVVRNPLWMLTIGMAFFFAALAAVMALG